jgi:tetratricopeptide (TPR) repeat protein
MKTPTAYAALAAAVALPLVVGEDPMPYGSVDFPNSCSDKVSADFNMGISQMYSFWYTEALKTFDAIIAVEPTCCLAYYGAAMTYNHPIWNFFSKSSLAAAESYYIAASECAAQSAITQREADYIYTLGVYVNTTDPAVADPATRLKVYADTFNSKVYLPYGNTDENAGVLYGLSVLGVGYYSESEPNNNYPNLRLGGLIEEMMVLRNSNSPGGLHYIIHSYDQPPLASRALDAAYDYLTVSVEVPHAIHMPSHIFGDLGLWADMISANQQALNLAWSQGDKPTSDWYHGSYFLQFGLLQIAMDCDAASFVQAFVELSESYTDGFVDEGCVRVPTMNLVETRNWEEAASFSFEKLYPAVPVSEWERKPWALVTANFIVTAARAILNRPVAEISAARAATDAANALLLSDEDWNIRQLPCWRLSFNVMVNSAHAWESFRATSFDAGIEEMQAVVAYQESNWAPEVAQAWDAHEQLAEMLLIRGERGDVVRALAAYEAAIATYPNRYHSLAGAAKCAQLLGDDVKTSRYYGDVSVA